MKTATASTKLFVGGLSADIDEERLLRAFSRFGNVTHISIATRSPAGARDGFGFVEFVEASSADAAVARLHGTSLAGQTLRVSRVDQPNAEGDDIMGWQRPKIRFPRRGRPRKNTPG